MLCRSVRSARRALASGAPLAVQRVPGVFNPHGEQTPTTLSSYASVSSATAVELRCDGGSGGESGVPADYYRRVQVTNIVIELTSAAEPQQTQAEDVIVNR